MRTFLSQTAAARPDAEGTWVPGLPHVMAALAAWPVLGVAPAISGLIMASLATFIVWLPLTALALNNGHALAQGDPAPALTPKAKLALFLAWTATAWLAAAIAR